MKKIIILTIIMVTHTASNCVQTEVGFIASEAIPGSSWNFELSNKAKDMPIIATLKSHDTRKGEVYTLFNRVKIGNGLKLRASLINRLLETELNLTIEHGEKLHEKKLVATLYPDCFIENYTVPAGKVTTSWTDPWSGQIISETKNKTEPRKTGCLNKIFLTFECPTTTFDSAKLRPQRGVGGIFSGLVQTSESGISLKHNISQEKIHYRLSNF